MFNETVPEIQLAKDAEKFAKAHSELTDDRFITIKELKNVLKNYRLTEGETQAVQYMLDKFKIISEACNDELFHDSTGITSSDLAAHKSRTEKGLGARDRKWDFLEDAFGITRRR